MAKAFRTFRAYENSKEWAAMSMPAMLVMSLYGGYVPYVSDRTNRWVVGLTATAWCAGNVLYCNGYAKSNEERMPGFNGNLNYERTARRNMSSTLVLESGGGALAWDDGSERPRNAEGSMNVGRRGYFASARLAKKNDNCL